MSFDEYRTAIGCSAEDGPLADRQRELDLLGAALESSFRLVFVVEQLPGAGGMRLVRSQMALRQLSDMPCHLVDSARVPASAYPGTLALAGLLGSIPSSYRGIAVLGGVQPLLTATRRGA